MDMTDCAACPLRQCDLFTPFSDDELDFMAHFKSGELTVTKGTTILMEGSNSGQLFTILKGMAIRYKLLEDGSRQVINFAMPGDFLGLQAGVMGEMQHSVEAASDMTLCVFRREALWDVFRSHPSRAFDLTWISAVEEHFLGETIATLGQRDGLQRVSWALTRLFMRLRAVGLGTRKSVPLPFRQQDMADALGLSLVHTNKTLAELRQQKIATWSKGVLEVHDFDKLRSTGLVDENREAKRPLL
ncbi:Crp/Fnr family transcriptional regulator [Pararhodobacter zhoushanensis]|uniref:Crp/Fnr family transcriptional regulator n=1 Tax=Pararhodobacter zhoushanensis TaxID=2479545 RepID=A0ABT3H256_9RHOB|nr:Crp/Fnr family transcriptional regulator [Pararhodobacter zhoushanensis]MCW1933843.1 Crp/Fnr family transcriptional regulator [Pararhodobacter zhoushanensis]